MKNKINEKELKQELLLMMDTMSKVDPIYKPGNYWKFYEKKIIKQILSNKLDQFRNWNGGADTSSVPQFFRIMNYNYKEILIIIFIHLRLNLK